MGMMEYMDTRNPIAAALDGLTVGFRNGESVAMSKARQEAELARQEEIMQIYRQQEKDRQAEIARKANFGKALQSVVNPVPAYFMPNGQASQEGQQYYEQALQQLPQVLQNVPNGLMSTKFAGEEPYKGPTPLMVTGSKAANSSTNLMPNAFNAPLADYMGNPILPQSTEKSPVQGQQVFIPKEKAILADMEKHDNAIVPTEYTEQQVLSAIAPYLNPEEFRHIFKDMGLNKQKNDPFFEKWITNIDKFDDKTNQAMSRLYGIDVNAYRKQDANYKQRDYLKGDRHVYEESYDGGQTWKPLSEAGRYKPSSGGGSNFRMDDSNRKFAVSLRKEFNNLPDVKESNEVMPKISSMRKAMAEAQKTGNYVAVDQALITLYNKLTDPTSVVRESEYARTAMNLPVMNRIKGSVQKVMSGGAGLTSNDRNSLMKMAELMNQGYSEIRKKRVNEYHGYAAQSGLEPSMVINDSHRESVPSSPSIPQGAIDKLKSNPKLAVYFDQKYGKGASRQYLGR